MNRILRTTSRSAASAVRTPSHTNTSSMAARYLTARNFSDSATGSDDHIKVGTVKNFNSKQHYGFILPDGMDENSRDLIFVHKNDIKQHDLAKDKFFPSLKNGQRVQFKVGPPDEGKKGGKGKKLLQQYC